MTVALLLYDDERARGFEPFITSRPVCEMTSGVASIRERWEEYLGLRCDGFLSSQHLAEFEEERAPAYHAGHIGEGCVVANARFSPALMDPRAGHAAGLADAEVWTSAGRVAAIRLRGRINAAELADGTMRLDKLQSAGLRSVDIPGTWMENVWDFIQYLPAQLTSDISCIFAAGSASGPSLRSVPREMLVPMRLSEAAAVLGENPVLVSSDATIDPYVVFDARNGPILVGPRATIHSFTRLEGPCFIGPDTTVMSGRIASSAIGEKCKISGELSNTIILGFSNKAHDGFVGHSYLGRWVNIGAGTITSNLKNTYGDVSLWTPHGTRQTGMQFLGTMFGDHARTGIGTTIATGTVIGAGANVFGGDMPPRYVPPFSWGRGGNLAEYQLVKFLEVAERVMSRRSVAVSDGLRRHFEEVHRHSRATHHG